MIIILFCIWMNSINDAILFFDLAILLFASYQMQQILNPDYFIHWTSENIVPEFQRIKNQKNELNALKERRKTEFICKVYDLFASFNVTKDSVNRSHFFICFIEIILFFYVRITASYILHKIVSAHFTLFTFYGEFVGGTLTERHIRSRRAKKKNRNNSFIGILDDILNLWRWMWFVDRCVIWTVFHLNLVYFVLMALDLVKWLFETGKQ